MGHRLTLAMRRWRATTQWHSGEPVDARLAVDVGSLEVVRGEGGVTPLSGPEKVIVRRNALGSLDARKYTRILFSANTIEKTDGGYRLTGALTIHGKTRPQVVDLGVDDQGDSWELSSETAIRQSDFGVKPYSQMLGALKVADDVTVSFAATRAKDATN
ncbi:YceI family protein [Mycobacterium cookii]|nr:YceI family protein [Mycobacterium cookii]